MLTTPIALIIFNRPDKLRRVIEQVSLVKPAKLLVIADGPRPNHPSDVQRCAEARAVIEQVDWECQVLTNYSDTNLGCGRRPATGISWVFGQVEQAIILEDDCVPHPTFFHFCQELLEKYRDDERIMHIGGINLYPSAAPYSYYFSRIPACVGGWATWRRAWQYFDMDINLWPLLRGTDWLEDAFVEPRAVELYRNIFDEAHIEGSNADYWDYQWVFACLANHGLAILPAKTNLISNIGFDADATHTTSSSDRRANLPLAEMVFPLRHPPHMVRDRATDQLRIKWMLGAAGRKNRSLFRSPRKIIAAVPASLRREIRHLLASQNRRRERV
ncbi:MAG TPA: glycosyltransferase family 2 protein [Candidatus Eisenbacteria bacterium]|nr:glycosyltransferase family 2 protein [Candidatus Eisenbacteria bacterium]